MLFYFVRHGETEANRGEVLAGSGIDHPLNETGHAQAQNLAQKFRSLIDHPIHRLVASEMTRARQTAEYIARHMGLPLEVNADLREWHLGEWEGKSYAEFAHLILGDGEPREGESRRDFYARIHGAWQGIHSDTEPYVLVSHGAVWLAIQDFLRIPRFKINNCELVRIKKNLKEGVWEAEVLKL